MNVIKLILLKEIYLFLKNPFLGIGFYNNTIFFKYNVTLCVGLKITLINRWWLFNAKSFLYICIYTWFWSEVFPDKNLISNLGRLHLWRQSLKSKVIVSFCHFLAQSNFFKSKINLILPKYFSLKLRKYVKLSLFFVQQK